MCPPGGTLLVFTGEDDCTAGAVSVYIQGAGAGVDAATGVGAGTDAGTGAGSVGAVVACETSLLGVSTAFMSVSFTLGGCITFLLLLSSSFFSTFFTAFLLVFSAGVLWPIVSPVTGQTVRKVITP